MSTFTSFTDQAVSTKINVPASLTKTYRQFGHGRYSYELASDLLKFRDELKNQSALSPCFMAVFKNSDDLSESEFQKALTSELSSLIHHSEVAAHWEPQLCADADRKTFCFTLDGTTFSVTGLHPYSASLEQRADCPTLIFEVYEDFKEHFDEGRFEPAVLGSSVNTHNALNDLLADLHMDETSGIRFSGRENTNWKSSFSLALGQSH